MLLIIYRITLKWNLCLKKIVEYWYIFFGIFFGLMFDKKILSIIT